MTSRKTVVAVAAMMLESEVVRIQLKVSMLSNLVFLITLFEDPKTKNKHNRLFQQSSGSYVFNRRGKQ